MSWLPEGDDNALLFILNLISTSLSLIGSGWMCYSCIRLKQKTVAHKLISAIAVSDFFYTLSNVISMFGEQSNDAICCIEASMRHFSAVMTIFFSSSTAVLCYRVVTSPKDYDQKRFLKEAIIAGTIYSLILTLSPFYLKDEVAFQQENLICAITNSPKITSFEAKLLILMLLQSTPVFVGLSVTLVCYVLTIRQMKDLPTDILKQMNVSMYKLLCYPLALFIVFIPHQINQFMELTSVTPLWMTAIYLGLTHSIGFINAVVYRAQKKTYENSDDKLKFELSVNLSNNYDESFAY